MRALVVPLALLAAGCPSSNKEDSPARSAVSFDPHTSLQRCLIEGKNACEDDVVLRNCVNTDEVDRQTLCKMVDDLSVSHADPCSGMTRPLSCCAHLRETMRKDCEIWLRPARLAKLKPEMYVRADFLASAYKTNEIKADSQFKGKRLDVEGRVRRIAVILGKPVIILQGVGFGEDVQVALDPSAVDQASELKPGTSVVLNAACDGGGAVGGVLLSNGMFTPAEAMRQRYPSLFDKRGRRLGIRN